jgi:tetratricopeptide (TPR) repeat protein
MSRLEKLTAMLAENPQDIFLRYAIGMELKGQEQYEEAISLFTELTRETPPYVPAFFMSAQSLAAIDRINEARSVLRDGIEVARVQGDSHAAGEMSEFLASLGAYGE